MEKNSFEVHKKYIDLSAPIETILQYFLYT